MELTRMPLPPRSLRAAVLFAALAALAPTCNEPPKPVDMTIRRPVPPDPKSGELRVFGVNLPRERAEEVRKALRDREAELLTDYLTYLQEFPSASGLLQLRIGFNKDGKVASIGEGYSDADWKLAQHVRELLEKTEIAPGPEAWVYYTLEFRLPIFDVLGIEPQFDARPPNLAVTVVNRSSFHVPSLAVTVRVMAPQKSTTLRLYRRRLKMDCPPGATQTLEVPVASEFATARNSFLVDVDPRIEEPKSTPPDSMDD